jgi:hypothetical protein
MLSKLFFLLSADAWNGSNAAFFAATARQAPSILLL